MDSWQLRDMRWQICVHPSDGVASNRDGQQARNSEVLEAPSQVRFKEVEGSLSLIKHGSARLRTASQARGKLIPGISGTLIPIPMLRYHGFKVSKTQDAADRRVYIRC